MKRPPSGSIVSSASGGGCGGRWGEGAGRADRRYPASANRGPNWRSSCEATASASSKGSRETRRPPAVTRGGEDGNGGRSAGSAGIDEESAAEDAAETAEDAADTADADEADAAAGFPFGAAVRSACMKLR